MKHFPSHDWVQYGQIILGNLLCTLAYTTINVPKGVINGGLTSFSMVVSCFADLPVWLILDGAMLLLLLGCWAFLGRTYFYRSIVSAIFYSVFFTGFSAIMPELPCSLALAMVISSIMVGTGCFFCIHAQASTLGFDVVAMILHKKNQRIGIARAMFFCNALVILMGWMTYGFVAIAAGLAGSAIQSFTLGRMLKKWPRSGLENV